MIELSEAAAVWLTGLPSSGKTTIAKRLAAEIKRRGYRVEVLESDALRKVITPKATYSEEERDNFYHALAYIGYLLVRNGVNVIFDATANKRKYRDEARKMIKKFIEVHVKCSLEECIRRDSKGLYRRALRGEIKSLPGLQAPYEEPINPEVTINTELEGVDEAVEKIVEKFMKVIRD